MGGCTLLARLNLFASALSSGFSEFSALWKQAGEGVLMVLSLGCNDSWKMTIALDTGKV